MALILKIQALSFPKPLRMPHCLALRFSMISQT